MKRPCIKFLPYYGRWGAFIGGTMTLRKTFEEAIEVVREYYRKRHHEPT